MKKICLSTSYYAFSCSEQRKKKEQLPSIPLTLPASKLLQLIWQNQADNTMNAYDL